MSWSYKGQKGHMWAHRTVIYVILIFSKPNSLLFIFYKPQNTFLFKDTPDVTVKVQNATTADPTSDVLCQADGVPNEYTYVTWQHTWPGHTIVLRSFPGSEVLRLERLTYEYSGYYTCRAENGVHASRNPGAGSGSAYLLIKGATLETILNALLFTSHSVLSTSFDHVDVDKTRNRNRILLIIRAPCTNTKRL